VGEKTKQGPESKPNIKCRTELKKKKKKIGMGIYFFLFRYKPIDKQLIKLERGVGESSRGELESRPTHANNIHWDSVNKQVLIHKVRKKKETKEERTTRDSSGVRNRNEKKKKKKN
jgi:hypothetical protein